MDGTFNAASGAADENAASLVAGGTVRNTSNSTLDGMIVLAGNTTAYTQDDNYKVVQTRATGEGAMTTVAFDMATARDETELSGGFGYFGTTEISGTVFNDDNFDGKLGDSDAREAGQEVRLTQWFYLDGKTDASDKGAVVTKEGKPYFVSAEVTNNKNELLRSSYEYENTGIH